MRWYIVNWERDGDGPGDRHDPMITEEFSDYASVVEEAKSRDPEPRGEILFSRTELAEATDPALRAAFAAWQAGDDRVLAQRYARAAVWEGDSHLQEAVVALDGLYGDSEMYVRYADTDPVCAAIAEALPLMRRAAELLRPHAEIQHAKIAAAREKLEQQEAASA